MRGRLGCGVCVLKLEYRGKNARPPPTDSCHACSRAIVVHVTHDWPIAFAGRQKCTLSQAAQHKECGGFQIVSQVRTR